MKLLIAALLATAAAATTSATTSATSSCAAENILQACLSTENDLLASCGTNDWDCKCNAYGAIVTCYNNCPGDTRRSAAEGQQQIFCGYASQYPSSTSTAAATTGTGTATGAAGTAKTTTQKTGTATSTADLSSGTSSAATVTATSGASGPAVQAGMLFAVGGAMAAML